LRLLEGVCTFEKRVLSVSKEVSYVLLRPIYWIPKPNFTSKWHDLDAGRAVVTLYDVL
jgi:hypothetical protein